MRKLNTAIVAALILLIGLYMPVVGQFLGVSVVTDPGAYARLAEDLQQAIRLYEATTNIVDLTQRAYDNVTRAATNITHKDAWLPSSTVWNYPESKNTYGTSGGWTAAANNGGSGADGYNAAALELQDYSAVWDGVGSTEQNRISRHYATVELFDSSTTNSLNTLGEIRQASFRTNDSIAALADDIASNDDELNTQVGVLNQVAAAGLVGARMQQSLLQTQIAMLDGQAVESKVKRDSMVQSFSDDIALKGFAAENKETIWAGDTDARRAGVK